MVVPCIVKIWLYVLGRRAGRCPAVMSCVRISMAKRDGHQEEDQRRADVEQADALVVGRREPGRQAVGSAPACAWGRQASRRSLI